MQTTDEFKKTFDKFNDDLELLVRTHRRLNIPEAMTIEFAGPLYGHAGVQLIKSIMRATADE